MATTITTANHIYSDADFVTDAVSELPKWLQEKENFSKLVEWYAERWDAMDKQAIKLAYLRMIAGAEGEVLDVLGERVGIYRYGQTDTEYKALIQLRAFRQTKGDTRPDIVELMLVLFSGEAPIILKGDLNFVEVIISPTCLSSADLSNQLDDMFPINTNLSVAEVTGTPLFLVDLKDGLQPDRTGGLNDDKTITTSGGVLVDWVHSSAKSIKTT